MLMILYREYPK